MLPAIIATLRITDHHNSIASYSALLTIVVMPKIITVRATPPTIGATALDLCLSNIRRTFIQHSYDFHRTFVARPFDLHQTFIEHSSNIHLTFVQHPFEFYPTFILCPAICSLTFLCPMSCVLSCCLFIRPLSGLRSTSI